MRHAASLGIVLASAALLMACSPQKIQQSVSGTLQVGSSSVAAGKIADRCGCNGAGVSPEVSWNDPPPGTRSFAVIMDDQDATIGHLHRHYFVHWVAFDLRPDRREIPEGAPTPPLNDDERLGTNDVRQPAYGGPCPDKGRSHHYAITVYALDTRLGSPATTDGRHLLTAIDGHILARGQIIATYTR
jgi:hypothetical protein